MAGEGAVLLEGPEILSYKFWAASGSWASFSSYKILVKWGSCWSNQAHACLRINRSALHPTLNILIQFIDQSKYYIITVASEELTVN
jgi:hypothetical protein